MAKGYDVWCISCGCIMKIRRGKYGDFYGCTGYPTCRNTMNLRDAALDKERDEANHGSHGSASEYYAEQWEIEHGGDE